MFTAGQCRRVAEECEQDASQARSQNFRETMLTIASMWRALAEHKEQKADHEGSNWPENALAKSLA